MDTETWEQITPTLIKGYIATSKHARMLPNWWMLEIVDGFVAHLASDAALKLRFDAKLTCIKEEVESSSYNQAYDQFVAKSDKLHQEEATNILKCT